jgi:hypothetical protein
MQRDGFEVCGIVWRYDGDAGVWRSPSGKWVLSENNGVFTLVFPTGATQEIKAVNMYAAMLGAYDYIARYNYWKR